MELDNDKEITTYEAIYYMYAITRISPQSCNMEFAIKNLYYDAKDLSKWLLWYSEFIKRE